MTHWLNRPPGLFALVLLAQLVVEAATGTSFDAARLTAAVAVALCVAVLWHGLTRIAPRWSGAAEDTIGDTASPQGQATPAADGSGLGTHRLGAVFAQMHEAVLLFDPLSGRLLGCNPRARALLELPTDDAGDLLLADLHDEDPSQLRSLVDDVMDGRQGRTERINYRRGDNGVAPMEVCLSRVEVNGEGLLLCIAREPGERDGHASEHAQYLAYHDTLTGLPNRMLLSDRVNRALARTRRNGQHGALLFLDLDRFKRINDSLGHSVGDELLKRLAERLRQTLREEDTVARLGGDEFVVLLERLGNSREEAVAAAAEIAEKIHAALRGEYRLNGHALYVTASIGIVTYPHDGDSVDALLRHADTAMYHAKGAGRNGARVFERSMDEAAMSRLRHEEELRHGLQEGQFELYFQPVLTIRDGHVLGAEVLLRWHHPTAGLIAPSDFLRYVEDCALMLQLDDWVLGETCKLLGAIQADPTLQTPDYLAVNVSHQHFHQPDFVERVTRTLAQTGADPRHLQFEITETVLIKDAKDSIDRIHALRQLGIRFAIDDFGTGYSSLADLRLLPIDTLKIDRSFIRDIATDPHDAAIVRAILSVAGHLGVQVVAEGVETREQLQFLRTAGCSFYQGYLGRPPLSAERLREDLRFNADLYSKAANPVSEPPATAEP